MCTPAEEESCKEEFGDNVDWACANCPKGRWNSLDDYTVEMLHVRMLRIGGFPLRREELSINEWYDQGLIETVLGGPAF